MAEIAFAAFLAVIVVAGSVHAARRRRRELGRRPLVLATAGGRALAANVGELSHLHVGLELPRRK